MQHQAKHTASELLTRSYLCDPGEGAGTGIKGLWDVLRAVQLLERSSLEAVRPQRMPRGGWLGPSEGTQHSVGEVCSHMARATLSRRDQLLFAVCDTPELQRPWCPGGLCRTQNQGAAAAEAA